VYDFEEYDWGTDVDDEGECGSESDSYEESDDDNDSDDDDDDDSENDDGGDQTDGEFNEDNDNGDSDENDDYVSGWDERCKVKERDHEKKKFEKKEGMEKEGEQEDGGLRIIGSDPPHDYLAEHKFVLPLAFNVQAENFPLRSGNSKNKVLLRICAEIRGRDWGGVISSVFSYLLRNIYSNLPDPVLKNIEVQFANYLTESDNKILGSAGWAQNTISFWKSKASSGLKTDFHFKHIADISFRLLSSPTSSSEIDKVFPRYSTPFNCWMNRFAFYSIHLFIPCMGISIFAHHLHVSSSSSTL
jgi:hypothetical protein